MRFRTDLLENKKREIETIVSNTLLSLNFDEQSSEEILKFLINNKGLEISAPISVLQEQGSIPPHCLGLITDIGRGDKKVWRTIKPGNIKLNMRLLFDALPDFVSDGIDIVSGSDSKKILAVLNILKRLKKLSTVEITKDQAIAIVAIWKNSDNHCRIPLDKGYPYYISLQNNTENATASWDHYIGVIKELEKLGSLKLDDNGIICLIEEIIINYD